MGRMSKRDNDSVSVDDAYEGLIALSFNDSCTQVTLSDSEIKTKIQMADQRSVIHELQVSAYSLINCFTYFIFFSDHDTL